MQQRRPVNLNFLTIKFPITAWVSILHRLSGALVFLLIPVLLWMLQESLSSETRYYGLINQLHHPLIKTLLFGFLAALFYHFIAGVRHLLMDIHIGESKHEGKVGAWLVLGVSLIISISIGCWLW